MSANALKSMGKGAMTAEKHRNKKPHDGFVGKIFNGQADFKMFENWHQDTPEMKARADEFIRIFREHFVNGSYDPELADETKSVRPQDVQWLCDNGFFGLKIPEKYGGANLTQSAYMRVMEAISYATDVCIPASAANTIGVGYPVLKYGTEDQRDRFLPIVAKNPTGFAFTEKDAGSDPKDMKTRAKRVFQNGKLIGYLLNGEKIWTTNGPKNLNEYLSPLLSVIAKIVSTEDELERNQDNDAYDECFGCFVVPTNETGVFNSLFQLDEQAVELVDNCDAVPRVSAQSFFSGLNGICNGSSKFDNVFVPVENLVGEEKRDPADEEVAMKNGWHPREGAGFRIAIEALNTGRITIASSCMANARQCLSMGKWWANYRNQWGQLGKHEAVGSGMLATGLADAFAMQAMTLFAGGQSDRGLECRLEAGIAKIFASERAWTIVDNLMQMSGGRGYETAKSKRLRGEPALPIERYWRAMRPNRIFEGATELLQMWTMREGSDKYMKRGLPLMKYKNRITQTIMGAKEFIPDLVKLSMPSRNGIALGIPENMLNHLKYVQRTAKRLAKTLIMQSGKHQLKLGKKQLQMGRMFWIVAELFAMSASCYYAMHIAERFMTPNKPHWPDGGHAWWYIELADFYCNKARLRIEGRDGYFDALTNNTDAQARSIATMLLDGLYDRWLKEDIIPIVDVLGLENTRNG